METRTWNALWIEPEQTPVTEEPAYSLYEMFVLQKEPPAATPPETRLHAPYVLKRAFDVAKPVAKATMHMTARGVYLARVNGKLVSDAVLAPDYTQYAKLLMYQSYDVTSLVREGENVWGATLADGWYAGRVSTQGNSCQYGDRLSILGELELEYEDGTRELVCTDGSWASATERYVYADIQIGEKQDLRLANDAWATNTVVDGWSDVSVVEAPAAEVVPQKGPQVVRRERLAAVDAWREGDAWVIDFGQVIAGRCVLECDLAEGQEIRLEHAEVIDAEGKFLMNIVGRNKDACDVFIGRGRHEVLEPDFTFHGFRYVRLSGWEGDFDPACITAVALYSDMKTTGRMTTSDARVNRLLENVVWSQRGNMVSIPTDCPQRERMGWTGDIEVYAPTGCFFQDLNAFLQRWLDQVMADQMEDGQILDYSPATKDEYASGDFLGAISSSGWGDAIVLVPLQLYHEYGDKAPLENCYEAMLRWHEFSKASAAGDKEGSARYIWDTKFHYGDWMLPSLIIGDEAVGPIKGAELTGPIVATCYLAMVSDKLAEVSELLGHAETAAEQRAYAQAVREAYVEHFYLGEGKLSVEFQGPYVLALAFDMVPEGEREAVAAHLVEMIHANGDRLDTGFLSIPYLLDTLQDAGYDDLAATLFWQSECPSWLYEVDRGATTIWETWANIAPDGKVGISSFNHYAFGCVADWIVRKVGGLVLCKPGYREFDVAPTFVRGFSHAELEHECAYGTIKLSWKATGIGHEVNLTVPEGATAHVKLPGTESQDVAAGTYEFLCD